jgi:hypothetical protein
MSHNVSFIGSEQWKRSCELFGVCVERFFKLVGMAMDVLERHLNDKYGPVCHRAAKTMVTLAGIGRSVAKSLIPGYPKPSPAPLQGGMSPATMKALAQAVSAMDGLGMGHAPPSATPR